MVWRVICTCCEWQYYRINYKYERFKQTRTKSCYKVLYVDSFVNLFSSCIFPGGGLKFMN